MEKKFTYRFNILAFIISILVFAVAATLISLGISKGTGNSTTVALRTTNLVIGMMVGRYFSKEQTESRKASKTDNE